MKDIHIVSIVGLGAIGSYFAEKIQPVLKDNLRIIAGGRRKEQLEKEGRIINGHQRFFHLVSPEENTGYSDLVLICSKMTGLKQALKDAGNQITFDPKVSYIEFGEQINDPNALSPKVQKVKEFFDLADIPSVIRPDMLRAIWEKYVCNVCKRKSGFRSSQYPLRGMGSLPGRRQAADSHCRRGYTDRTEKRNSHRRKLCRKASGPSQKTSPWQHAIHPSRSPGRPQNRGGNVRRHHPAHGKRAGYTHTL